jgi:hypothetical protein
LKYFSAHHLFFVLYIAFIMSELSFLFIPPSLSPSLVFPTAAHWIQVFFCNHELTSFG